MICLAVMPRDTFAGDLKADPPSWHTANPTDLETLGMGGPKDHFGTTEPDDLDGMGMGGPRD